MEKKKRVRVSDEVFIPRYKSALDSGTKLAEFAKEIGQAEQSILHRVAKYNQQLKSTGYPTIGYLSQAKDKVKKTPDEIAKMFGLTLSEPV